MAKKRNKKDDDNPRIVSPKGKALYPFLFKPQTKFNEEGVFKISVVLNLKDAGVKEFLTSIKKFNDDNGGGKLPYDVDKDAGTATVKFKSSRQPVVKDAKCNVIEDDPMLANNSVVRASGRLARYEGFGGGTTIYLNGVQIIDLIVYQPDDGFEEEDGYSVGDSSDESAPDGADDFEGTGLADSSNAGPDSGDDELF